MPTWPLWVQRERATIVACGPPVRWRCVIAWFRLLAFGDMPDPTPNPGEHRPPTVIANPHGDDRFRAMIDRLLTSRRRGPEDLQAALRAWYPGAVVRPRALAGEPFEVWYVYRDGHWIGGASDDQV